MRLIDADKLKECFKTLGKEDIIQIIDDVKTVRSPMGYRPIDDNCWEYFGLPEDTVRIIRCKNCKFYELASNGTNGHCRKRVDDCNVFYPNDYCSLGEREYDNE